MSRPSPAHTACPPGDPPSERRPDPPAVGPHTMSTSTMSAVPDNASRLLRPAPRSRVVVGLSLALAVAASGCGGTAAPDIVTEQPADGFIAYDAGDGIHLVAPDGSGDRKAASLSGPRWAADGRRFAAVDLADCCKAYAVAIDGSGLERLPSESSTTPDWSPDGTRLAVYDERGDGRIHVVRIADGVDEAVIPKRGNYPAWSPDGSTIAFQGDGADGLLRIFLASSSGKDVRQLTTARGGDEGEYGAAWSPNGRWIAFGSDADGDADIYVVRANGSGYRKVTRNAIDDSSPSWSPEGSRLVFGRTWPDKTAIVVLELATGMETTVARGGLDFGDLVFAPDWQPRPKSSR